MAASSMASRRKEGVETKVENNNQMLMTSSEK